MLAAHREGVRGRGVHGGRDLHQHRQRPGDDAAAQPLATRGRAFAPRLAIRKMAARIDAATPAGRDRSVDALRALAIAGVILGHWLVTALVLTRSPSGARLHDASPLAALPALAPASWIFQTLAIFFFVAMLSASNVPLGAHR